MTSCRVNSAGSRTRETGQPIFGSTHAPGVVRIWALVDILAAGPLLLPGTALWYIEALYRLDALVSGEQQTHMPELAGLALLFVCMTGALAVLWALVRLLWPLARLSLADTLGRLWVALLIMGFITGFGLPSILWIFVLTEMAGALHQGSSLLRYKRIRHQNRC